MLKNLQFFYGRAQNIDNVSFYIDKVFPDWFFWKKNRYMLVLKVKTSYYTSIYGKQIPTESEYEGNIIHVLKVMSDKSYLQKMNDCGYTDGLVSKEIVENAYKIFQNMYFNFVETLKYENRNKKSEKIKNEYDKWFYKKTITYNGKTIHIDNQIKSIQNQSSQNQLSNGVKPFYIGHKIIDSRDYFYVLVEVNDFYKLIKFSCNKVQLLETNEIRPCLAALYDKKDTNDAFDKINLIIVSEKTIIVEL